MIPSLNHLGVAFTPYAWLGHVLMGLGIQLAVVLPLNVARVRSAWWIAAAVSAGFWWGREKVGYEFALKAAAGLHTLGPSGGAAGCRSPGAEAAPASSWRPPPPRCCWR